MKKRKIKYKKFELLKKGKEMQRKTLLNPKGIKERVLPKDVLAKLQAGYKVPNKMAYLYNSAGNLKKIDLEKSPEGQKKVVELLKQGYSFDPTIVKPQPKPISNMGELINKLDGQFADYKKQITAPLNAQIEELEKKLKEKEEEFEIFRKLSQINIEKAKKLTEENTALKKKVSSTEVFNAVTKQLLDIIATNELEEIVLNHKEDKYTFSVIVKK